MGATCDVRIKIGNSGYQRFLEIMELRCYGEGLKLDNLVKGKDSFFVFGFKSIPKENSREMIMLKSLFDEVGILVEEDPDMIESYFYKAYLVDDSDEIEIFTNDEYGEFTGDFYPIVGFSI